jgi:hypothetical protein
MGSDHVQAGQNSQSTFARVQYTEEGQIASFAMFLAAATYITCGTQEQRVWNIAKKCNGPGYRTNRYDEKISASYKRTSAPTERTSKAFILASLLYSVLLLAYREINAYEFAFLSLGLVVLVWYQVDSKAKAYKFMLKIPGVMEFMLQCKMDDDNK